jgi:hypothetical protein
MVLSPFGTQLASLSDNILACVGIDTPNKLGRIYLDNRGVSRAIAACLTAGHHADGSTVIVIPGWP